MQLEQECKECHVPAGVDNPRGEGQKVQGKTVGIVFGLSKK
jgi:hypothetical protein